VSRRPALFYGWVIVAVTVIGMLIIYGVRHSFSVFFVDILDEFGWSRGNTAIMFSLNVLIYGLLAPVAGSLGDRWKPRRIMPLGAALLGLATAGCGLANELWHFYVLFGILMPVGTVFTGWPLFAPAISNWFVRRRATGLGIGLIGGGLSFTMGIFAEYLIWLLEWRWAYVVLAGMVIGIVIPVVLLFFHYRPADIGRHADGFERSVGEDPKPAPGGGAFRDWTLSQAVRTYQLWLLVLAFMLYFGVGNYLVLAHQVAFAEDIGYSGMIAASVFGLYGIFLAVGQVSGFIADRIGREKTFTLATLLSVAGLLLLISVRDASQPWMLYAYAICFGYGAGLMVPALIAGAADLFHGRHFGAINGLLLTGMGVGGAIGPWLGGFIFDIWGSYICAFIICIIAICLACLGFWVAAPRRARRHR